jgi:hypothetical protein
MTTPICFASLRVLWGERCTPELGLRYSEYLPQENLISISGEPF